MRETGYGAWESGVAVRESGIGSSRAVSAASAPDELPCVETAEASRFRASWKSGFNDLFAASKSPVCALVTTPAAIAPAPPESRGEPPPCASSASAAWRRRCMPGSRGCGTRRPNPVILSPAFGAEDLPSVFSSKCRFFGACWCLRMTLFVAFFRNLSSPALPLRSGHRQIP
jgi:hypothetical protein